jgi:hypothetical protein
VSGLWLGHWLSWLAGWLAGPGALRPCRSRHLQTSTTSPLAVMPVLSCTMAAKIRRPSARPPQAVRAQRDAPGVPRVHQPHRSGRLGPGPAAVCVWHDLQPQGRAGQQPRGAHQQVRLSPGPMLLPAQLHSRCIAAAAARSPSCKRRAGLLAERSLRCCPCRDEQLLHHSETEFLHSGQSYVCPK